MMTEILCVSSEHIASKVMDGEAILINLATGDYYSLDGTAGLIWSMIEKCATEEMICDVVCSQYAVPAERVHAEIGEFLAILKEEGLVRIGETRDLDTDVPELPLAHGDYVAPVMEKFTDMAEMFALDPPLPRLTGEKC